MKVAAQFDQKLPLSCISFGFFPDRVTVNDRKGHFQVFFRT
jgi:hypothetical protein